MAEIDLTMERSHLFGFFYHGNTKPKDYCDSIVRWNKHVDTTGFTEEIHADVFTGDPKWRQERNRTTLLAVLKDLNLCLYDLFPCCESPLEINRGVLDVMRNFEIKSSYLPVNARPVWFLQEREAYTYQGEQRYRWVRITEEEMLAAIEAGDILLDRVVRDAARTVLGKKGADWTAFEIKSQEVLKENSKLVSGFRWELFDANMPSRVMSIDWTDEVSPRPDPFDLGMLCTDFKACISDMPPPDKQPDGEPIDILRANWQNKVRHDWRTYYPLYLRSAEWYLVRQVFFMMRLGSWVCANRHCDTKATQIQHISYQNVACEDFLDLIPLCNRCHAYFHQQIGILEKSYIEELQRKHENRDEASESIQLGLRLRFN